MAMSKTQALLTKFKIKTGTAETDLFPPIPGQIPY
jgi:hypothetical protein